MGKKKRNHPDVEAVLARPWCYYCERDFDDLKILTNHQKAKHSKCERCGRRLNTAGGLSVHMNQVHKETLSAVDNALPNRSNLDHEIFGMEGIPEDVVQAHNQRILQQFYEAEAARRVATGNPAPGTQNNGPANKRPKVESTSDLKKRLAEHRARKAAQEASGEGSGNSTPQGQPGISQPPATFSPQPPYSGAHGSPSQAAFAPPYSQPPVAAHYGAPVSSFSPPPNGMPFLPPGQPYPSGGGPSFQPPFPGGPPRPYGTASPPMQFSGQGPSPSNGSLPPRPGSTSAAPGLPQRPTFGAPPVNPYQMQQMHQGHVPGQTAPSGSPTGLPVEQPPTATSIDELISSAAREADSAVAGKPAEKTTDATPSTEKKAKKGVKEKAATKLVYSDDLVSPEEKMARLPRYAVDPRGPQTAMQEVPTEGAVTGTVRGPDDVQDPMP